MANNQTTMRYDMLGRKMWMLDPDMGLWTYGYNAVGNLKTQDGPGSADNLAFLEVAQTHSAQQKMV